MANLVAIIDPSTGREYRVHPFIAECGEWLATSREGLRQQLPGVHAFERDLARLATQPHSQRTPSPEALHEKVAQNALEVR